MLPLLRRSIRSAKCQIFGIWHTKHQKQTIIKCIKCQKVLAFVTVKSHLLNDMEGNVIWFLLLFIHLSLSSQINKKLHFITLNYVLDYTLHPKPSDCTLCTLVLFLLLYLIEFCCMWQAYASYLGGTKLKD